MSLPITGNEPELSNQRTDIVRLQHRLVGVIAEGMARALVSLLTSRHHLFAHRLDAVDIITLTGGESLPGDKAILRQPLNPSNDINGIIIDMPYAQDIFIPPLDRRVHMDRIAFTMTIGYDEESNTLVINDREGHLSGYLRQMRREIRKD